MKDRADGPAYSPDVLAYLGRIYDESERVFACRAEDPDGVTEWQARARPELRRLLKLDLMETSLAGHEVRADLDEPEDMGDYTRRRGRLQTEPNVWIPFWLLRPKGDGPFPLALAPHGHDRFGYDTHAGVAADEARRRKILAEDRDVAVQAAREGFLAVAPATRGIGCDGAPDIHGRHGGRDCQSHSMHCLIAGRVAMGERVWDMERFIDWGLTNLEVHDRHLLMLGNSGGGMVTIYAAACDRRVRIAIPSCSFNSYVTPGGRIVHCDCNVVPGALRFGEFHDVAGLIAPRHLLVVNGRLDGLHDPADVDRAAAGVRRIYEAAGAADRFGHRYGEGGHRLYKDLMWPFVREILAQRLALGGR